MPFFRLSLCTNKERKIRKLCISSELFARVLHCKKLTSDASSLNINTTMDSWSMNWRAARILSSIVWNYRETKRGRLNEI